MLLPPLVPVCLCPSVLVLLLVLLLFFSSSSPPPPPLLLSHASPGPSPDPVVNVSPLRRVARIGRYGYSLTFSGVPLHPRPYFSIHRIHRNLPLHCVEQKNAFTLDLFPEATSVNSTQRRASFIGFRTRHQGMSVDAGSACPTRGLQRVAREACEFAASNSSLAPLAPWRWPVSRRQAGAIYVSWLFLDQGCGFRQIGPRGVLDWNFLGPSVPVVCVSSGRAGGLARLRGPRRILPSFSTSPRVVSLAGVARFVDPLGHPRPCTRPSLPHLRQSRRSPPFQAPRNHHRLEKTFRR